MLAQVDLPDSDVEETKCGLFHGLAALRCVREDRPVVVRIRRDIEQQHPGRGANRLGDGLYRRQIAPFADIRNCLDHDVRNSAVGSQSSSTWISVRLRYFSAKSRP